jgi:hypothetical protein
MLQLNYCNIAKVKHLTSLYFTQLLKRIVAFIHSPKKWKIYAFR